MESWIQNGRQHHPHQYSSVKNTHREHVRCGSGLKDGRKQERHHRSRGINTIREPLIRGSGMKSGRRHHGSGHGLKANGRCGRRIKNGSQHRLRYRPPAPSQKHGEVKIGAGSISGVEQRNQLAMRSIIFITATAVVETSVTISNGINWLCAASSSSQKES